VSFAIPTDKKVSRVQLLKSGEDVPFTRTGNGIAFTIPSITEYEVAAIYT
jgi:hypothetical protein